MPGRKYPDRREGITTHYISEDPECRPVRNPRRADCLKFISRELQLQPKLIYYPDCNTDISPMTGFSGAEIVFVDKNKNVVEALKKRGCNAICADTARYTLEQKADIILLLSPAMDTAGSVANLKTGGYVICDDTSGTATDMKSKSEFEFMGMAVSSETERDAFFKAEQAEQYWEAVDSDQVFIKLNPLLFEIYRGKVNRCLENTQKRESVVVEYAKLYEKNYKPDIKSSFDFDRRIGFPPLPRKIGTQDSLFVFQKKQPGEQPDTEK